jgi:hypothetical protein
VLSYRPDTRKVHILLKEGATPQDQLRAMFASHVLLCIVDQEAGPAPSSTSTCSPLNPATLPAAAADALAAYHVSQASQPGVPAPAIALAAPLAAAAPLVPGLLPTPDAEGAAARKTAAALSTAYKITDCLYPEFVKQAEKAGWKMGLVSTLLLLLTRFKGTRVCGRMCVCMCVRSVE